MCHTAEQLVRPSMQEWNLVVVFQFNVHKKYTYYGCIIVSEVELI